MRMAAIMLASLCGCGLDRVPDQTGWFQQFDLRGHVSLHTGSDGVLLQTGEDVTLLKGDDGSRVWSQQVFGAMFSNADGEIFSDDGGAIRHYAADSGELLWEVTASPVSSSIYATQIAANRDRVASVRSVFRSDSDQDCVTFLRDASTGAAIWTSVQPGTACCGAPTFAPNGDVLVVFETGVLIRHAASDGTEVEQIPLRTCPDRIVATPSGGLLVSDPIIRGSVQRLTESGSLSWEVSDLLPQDRFALAPDEDVILTHLNVEYGGEWNGDRTNEGGLRRIAGQTGADLGQAEFFSAPNDVATDSTGRVFASGVFNVNALWVAELDWQ